MFKTYYRLTKPGIIYGNAINIIAGFFLASTYFGTFRWQTLVAVIVGSSLVIGSGCVVNNYIDRDIDRKMERTKKRALVQGTVLIESALLFAAFLGAGGFGVLAAFTNWLTVIVGAVGYVFYVVVYGYAKRNTVYGTLVGSISGAVPPLAGYVAVSGKIDAGAVIVFLILVCWQMPHFYAIAMYRLKDYKAAGIPVWPVVKGMQSTKIQIMAFIIAFIAAAGALTVFGYTGYTYLGIVLGAGGAWLVRAMEGFKATDDAAWARKMFGFSLLVTLVMCVALSIGGLLP
jgi:protoheme IX farnesyltransferase